MADRQTTQSVTDTRFVEVLRLACDAVVDATGEGRNGDVFFAYKPVPPDAPWDVTPDVMTYAEWLTEHLGIFLRSSCEPLRMMVDARARLGQNVRLVEDIDLDRLRAGLDDSDKADKIDALLDFVAEVRKIAKEI